MAVDSVAEGLEVVAVGLVVAALVVAVGLEEVGLEVVGSVGLAVTILPWQEPGHIVQEKLLL